MSAIAAKSRYLRQTKGAELAQELLARLDVAGDDARLDQRRALPILTEALVIGEARVGRERDLRRAGIGPEPEIGAEDIAVGGMLLQQPHELAGQADEESCDGSMSGASPARSAS